MDAADPGSDDGRRSRPRRTRSSRPRWRRSDADDAGPAGAAGGPPPAEPDSPARGGFVAQRLVVLALLLVAAAVVVWLLRGRGIPEPGPVPATRPPGTGVVGLFVQPDDSRAPVLEEIDAAERSIALEVYLLSDEATIAALERAAARGVAVRVLLEENPFGGPGTEEEVFARLDAAGVDVRWSNPAFAFSHIKTLVVDDRVALIMNQNLTRSGFDANREINVVTTRPEEVAEAAAVFTADWARTAEPAPGPLVRSPTDSRETLLALIGSARRTLDVYAEAVRDREMIGAIVAAAERGVRVRLVMSGRAGDDFATERAELARAGVAVRLVNSPYIHAKLLLVDGERAFVGSQNLTATSLDQNRELGIVLDDPAALARIGRVFAADFAEGRPEEQA